MNSTNLTLKLEGSWIQYKGAITLEMSKIFSQTSLQLEVTNVETSQKGVFCYYFDNILSFLQKESTDISFCVRQLQPSLHLHSLLDNVSIFSAYKLHYI